MGSYWVIISLAENSVCLWTQSNNISLHLLFSTKLGKWGPVDGQRGKSIVVDAVWVALAMWIRGCFCLGAFRFPSFRGAPLGTSAIMVFYVTIATFRWTLLMNKWTNIAMDDGRVYVHILILLKEDNSKSSDGLVVRPKIWCHKLLCLNMRVCTYSSFRAWLWMQSLPTP